MNWQEVVNGTQQQAKANMNNQLGGAIPYMPLIFNQQNPAGAALSLALGNLINDAIGKRNDKRNVQRFADAKNGVDSQFAINPVQAVTPIEGMTEEQVTEANRMNAINNARNIRSSGDYYNALVDAAVRNGASRAKASEWAAKEAGVYQNNANKEYQNILNQYGYNGEGALNGIGMEMASLMANEGRGDYAKNIMQGNLAPKDMRMLAEKEAAEDRAFERKLALRSMFGGGGSGGGGSRGGYSGGSSPSYYNDDGSFNYRAYAAANRMPSGDRNKTLKELGALREVLTGTAARMNEQKIWFIGNEMDSFPMNQSQAWSWITKMQEAKDDEGNPLFTNAEIAQHLTAWLPQFDAAGLGSYTGETDLMYNAARNGTQTSGNTEDSTQKEQKQDKAPNERLQREIANNQPLLDRWSNGANNTEQSQYSDEDWRKLIKNAGR